MSLDGKKKKKKKKLCWPCTSIHPSIHSNHRKVCCGCNTNCTVVYVLHCTVELQTAESHCSFARVASAIVKV